MKRLWIIGSYLIAAVSLGMTENPYRAGSFPPRKLAFVRGNNIYVCDAGGTNQRLIIEDGQNPSWSPDKSQIAFVRRNNIWVAKADGSSQHPLTSQWKERETKTYSVPDVSISWHPKNGSMVFSHPEEFKIERVDGTAGIIETRDASSRVITAYSIFEVHAAGSEPVKATVRYDLFQRGTTFFFANHAHPSWSPSGKQLAFTRNGDIWIAKIKNASQGEPPIGWDTKRLAAVASYDEATYRASGTNRGATRLAWHPDERLLAYELSRLGGSGFNEIHLLDLATGKDTILVKDARGPHFSPDGKHVLYWTYAEDQCGKGICICTVSSDGKEKRKLMSDGKDPAW